MGERLSRRVDLTLLFAVILLAVIGALGVRGASLRYDETMFVRQLVWVGVGLGICLTVRLIDYHFFLDSAWFLYFLSLVALLATALFGVEVSGNRNWISVGGITFQPSEGAKLVVILALCRYVKDHVAERARPRDFVRLGVIVMLPAALIVLQGDLGTALVYGAILMGMAVITGLETRFLVKLAVAGLCMAPVGWFFLKDYQKERVLVMLDAERDPQGVGYQSRQSQVAIGSGGMFGKGIGKGLQSQLGFVPEVHTDFIYSLLAEETGFVGAVFILMLYLFVLLRLVRIGELARDRAGLLLTAGIASVLFFHIVINVGMTLGIMPSIGIPLPLLSYGGSNTLTTFAAFGIALSVHARRFGES